MTGDTSSLRVENVASTPLSPISPANRSVTFTVPPPTATLTQTKTEPVKQEIIPASPLWREKLALRGLDRDCPTTIKNFTLPYDYQIKDSSCMAVHNKFNHIAQGTRKSEIIQFIRAKPGSSGGIESVEYQRSTIDAPGEVFCMDWHGNNLLMGGDEGQVYLQKVEPTSSGVIDGDVTTYQHEMKTNASTNTPSPELYTFSSRVNCVRLNRFETSKLFLAVENHRLHVWDIEKQKAPIHTIKGSNGPLFSASWNPHQETMLMIGGVSRSLKLIDLREMKGGQSGLVAWRKEEAHSDAIRDIQWNPMIPHWVASAGNDGIVNVWDLRYNNQPMVSLEGHDNIVRSVSWSRYHCELLASGGIDQKIKIWSLKVQPHHLLATIGKLYTDSVIAVEFSRVKPLQCFTLSGCGEFATISLTPKFLEPLVFSRFLNEDETAEKDVEKLIFYRNFPTAFSKAVDMAKKYKEQNKLDKALRLLELCKEKSLSKNAKVMDAKVRFRKELSDYSYYIPPNLESVKKVDEKLRKNVDNLILNCQILRFVQRNDFHAVTVLETKLLELLRQDINCIEIETIKDVIQLYLSHEYKKGMTLVIRLGTIFQQKNEFSRFDAISKLILSPTTFEVSSNPNLQESAYRTLQKCLANAENIISQISLQRDVICALWEADSAHKIVNLIEHMELKASSGNPTYLETISQAVIRSYLNSLLCLNRLDRFFIVATEILQQSQGYDFSSVVKELMQVVGFEKLKMLLNDGLYSSHAITSAAKKGTSFKGSIADSDVQDFINGAGDSIVVVLNILFFCGHIPEYATTTFQTAVETIQLNCSFCFTRLGKSEQGAEQGVKFAGDIIRRLGRAKPRDSDDKESTLQTKAKQIKTMLIQFLDKHE